MGRKPKSSNKYISAKMRKEFDSILLVDKDFKEEPSQTLLRLYKSSKKITYTVFLEDYQNGNAESTDINDYVKVDKRIETVNPNVKIIVKDRRNSDSLTDDLITFYDIITDYMLKNLIVDEVLISRVRIKEYLNKIEKTINDGLKETEFWDDPRHCAFEFEHIFLLHSKRKKYIQLEHPANFDVYLKSNPYYGEKISKILKSWHVFWRSHLPFIKNLKKLFLTESTFKLKNGITYQNEHLQKWLEKGLDDFLQPIDPRMKEDSSNLIKYLKYIILSGQLTKPKKKKK